MLSPWSHGKVGYAYVGLGAGWDDGHALFRHARAALRTAGVRHQALPIGNDPVTFPSDEQVESAMRASDAVFVTVSLPDNADGRLDDAGQARLLQILHLEFEVAKRIRQESALRRREAESLRAERGREVVFVRLPKANSAHARGYTAAARASLRRLLDEVCTGHGKPEEFDASGDEIGVRIAADLFTHAPHISRADVLLSSTFNGLADVRERVRRAVEMLNQRYLGSGMAYNPIDFANLPRSTTELEESLRYVDHCTVYLGILGARMGTTRAPGDPSGGSLVTLTELEYAYAGKHGKQRAFLLGAPEAGEEVRGAGAASPDEDTRRRAFESQVRRDGIPLREFRDAEGVQWATLDLLGWMNRPSIDQQAFPPPNDRRWASVYVAHPYVLLDEQTEIARERAAESLRAWHADATRPHVCAVVALGGMGKSALAWRWVNALRTSSPRTRTMWWSFYARGSGLAQFAAHALWWILGDGAYGVHLEKDDLRGLYDRLLAELAVGDADYVLVLDGIERTFVCYEHFRGDIAVDEGPGLDVRLRDLARSMMSRGSPDETTALRYLRTFSEPGIDDTQALRTGEDRSEFARFLRAVAALPNVRVLLTSRFEPTAVEEMARERAAPARAEVYELRGLDEEEVKALWTRHGLAWEADPLPPELGGGTLADLCCRTLQGFALPISILAALVSQQAGTGTSFAAWKRALPPPLDSDPWCVPVADDAPPSQRLQHMGRVQGRILLRAIHRIRTDREDWSVLERVLSEPSGVGYSSLRTMVGREGSGLHTDRDLWHTLQRLRAWKIIGCSAAMDQYDAHPIMRRALQQATPEDDPHYAGFLKSKTSAWDAEDQTARAGESLPLDRLEPRWQTILNLLDEGGVLRAYELFSAYVEPHLRFRTRGCAVGRRGAWLDRAIVATSDMQMLRSGGVEYEILKGLLQCLLADNLMLEGRVADARRQLDSVSRQALELAEDKPQFGYSLLLQADRWRTLAHVEQASCRLAAAALALRASLACAQRLRRTPSLEHHVTDRVRWAACGLVGVFARIGRSAEIAPLLERLTWSHDPEQDADVAVAAVHVALDRGTGVGEALAVCDRSVAADSLQFGAYLARRLRLRWRVESLTAGAADAAEIAAACVALAEAASRDGFRDIALDARGLLSRARAAAGVLSPQEVVDQLAALARELDSIGSTSARAEVLASEAEAHLRLGDAAAAAARVQEALRHVLADGPEFANRRLHARLVSLLRQAGGEPSTSTARPATTPEDAGRVTRDVVEELSRAFAPRTPGAPRGVSDTRSWTPEQVRAQLARTKEMLDWANTTGSARKWWEAFERENEHRVALVLRLAEELVLRKSTITEFFLAYVYSNTDNIQANLHYHDYARLKKEEEKRKKAASPDGSPVAGSRPAAGAPRDALRADELLERPPAAGVSVTHGWTDDRLAARLVELRASLGWETTTGSARKWWETFERENGHRVALVLRLAEELLARKATITEFFLAYVYSNTDNLQANLEYLDYTRLKKEEEVRKRKAAEEAAERARAQARLEATTLAQSIRPRVAARDPSLALDPQQRALLRDHPPSSWSDAELELLRALTTDPPIPSRETDGDPTGTDDPRQE